MKKSAKEDVHFLLIHPHQQKIAHLEGKICQYFGPKRLNGALAENKILHGEKKGSCRVKKFKIAIPVENIWTRIK